MATVSLEAFLLHLVHKAEQTRSELNRKKTMIVELRTLEFWRAIIAECLATFIYVFLVCGSHVMWPLYSINTLTKSFANGLAMATAAQCFGHISGAHVNPAFTFAMLVIQKRGQVDGSEIHKGSYTEAWVHILLSCSGVKTVMFLLL
ncbi:unnamed protein product [Larinioides sclopetarius]|uniref:Aquaporin n=1 Tax=Larinioides sclopetarius TaxID=280406 RepID=A0AAV1ZFZ6_9ARAC